MTLSTCPLQYLRRVPARGCDVDVFVRALQERTIARSEHREAGPQSGDVPSRQAAEALMRAGAIARVVPMFNATSTASLARPVRPSRYTRRRHLRH